MRAEGPGAGKRSNADALVRERAVGAMLELSGEIGYRAVTVEQLLDRGEVTVEQFDHQFGDLESCFAAAYAAEAEALCEVMLAAAKEAGEWRAGVRAALLTVLRFAAKRPAVANALVREVHVVGGAALLKHEEVLERLTVAIERGCAVPADELATVPRAPSFVVGAVEGVISGRLARGETDDLPAVASELMFLIVASFLGAEEAADELDRDSPAS